MIKIVFDKKIKFSLYRFIQKQRILEIMDIEFKNLIGK